MKRHLLIRIGDLTKEKTSQDLVHTPLSQTSVVLNEPRDEQSEKCTRNELEFTNEENVNFGVL